MRTASIFDGANKRDRNAYLTEAAAKMASIQHGIDYDGEDLRVTMTPVDREDFVQEVFTILDEDITAVAKYTFGSMNLNQDDLEDITQMLRLKMFKEFYRYNNPNYLKDGTKKYEIRTFIENMATNVKDNFLMEKSGLCQNEFRNMRLVNRARHDIAVKSGISVDKVTAEMIRAVLEDISLSISMINYLLIRSEGDSSFDEMYEKSSDALMDLTSDESFDFDFQLPDTLRVIVDTWFDNLTELEKFMILRMEGFLGENLQNCSVEYLFGMPLFCELYSMDDTIKNRDYTAKSIYDKTNTVKRKYKKLFENLCKSGLCVRDYDKELIEYLVKKLEA